MGGFYRAPITPGQTWFSPVGGGNVPAAAGTITTYLAGTTTPVATYTSQTGGTPNTNPIVLNSVGGLPNDVWIAGGVAIKLVILDAAGNPIATVDNVVGVDDPAFASGSFGQWIAGPAATWLTATMFSAAGDQTSLGPLTPNRRLQIVSAAGTTYATITRSTYDVGTLKTTVTFVADSGSPAATNPISAINYGLLSSVNPSVPPNVIPLGGARYSSDSSNRTGVDLFGSIGSNFLAFRQPHLTGPASVLTSVDLTTGLFTWASSSVVSKLKSGAVVMFSGTAAPGALTLDTPYVYFSASPTTGYFYAIPPGWIHEMRRFVPPSGGLGGSGTGGNANDGGGFTWAPAVSGTSGAGTTWNMYAAFVAPPGVTRVFGILTGGGGGGAGAAASGASHVRIGQSGTGASTTFGWHAVTPGSAYKIQVGLGGLAGGASNGDGGAGEDSTFTSDTGTMDAAGGIGGAHSAADDTSAAGIAGPGAVINDTLQWWGVDGGPSGSGIFVSTTAGFNAPSGGSYWGPGMGIKGQAGTASGAGTLGVDIPGRGGQGAMANNASTVAGSAGSDGIVILQW